ncbi:MAG: DUF2304 domain-containing protein [Anaerolineae bacterium]
MIDRATLFGLAASVAGLIFVLELVRQRKLREDYSLLWLATTIILIVLSVSRLLLDLFAALLGVVTYPPAALFLVAIIFMLFILLHFSTVLYLAGARKQGHRSADGDPALGTGRGAEGAARLRRSCGRRSGSPSGRRRRVTAPSSGFSAD